MANTYDVGDLIRLTATFTDANGDAVDPTTVSFSIRDPSGNLATVTYAAADITKSGTGVYFYDLSIDEVGYWVWRAVGTGAGEAAGEDTIEIRPQEAV